MTNEFNNEVEQETLNPIEEQRKRIRKQTIWRWVVIGISALILAAIIIFFVCGAGKDNVPTEPSIEVALSTNEIELYPDPTKPFPQPIVTDPTIESTTQPKPKPNKKPSSSKPSAPDPTTESTEPESTNPTSPKPSKWKYDDSLKPEKNIFIYLTDYLGYSDAAACGIVANIAYETGWKFNPDAGDPNRCYGLIQWLGGRLKNLKSWCKKNGRDYHTIQGQLDFMDWELKNADPYGTYDYITKCKDSKQGAYNAGKYFCYWYERPNNKTKASKWRGGEARKYYKEFVLGEG